MTLLIEMKGGHKPTAGRASWNAPLCFGYLLLADAKDMFVGLSKVSGRYRRQ